MHNQQDGDGDITRNESESMVFVGIFGVERHFNGNAGLSRAPVD